MANKLDPGKCDFVREYLEAAAATESERGGGEWAVKGQLMRGGRVGTELVQKLLQRLTGTRPLTPTAVDSFLSVVSKDTGKYHYRVLTVYDILRLSLLEIDFMQPLEGKFAPRRIVENGSRPN